MTADPNAGTTPNVPPPPSQPPGQPSAQPSAQPPAQPAGSPAEPPPAGSPGPDTGDSRAKKINTALTGLRELLSNIYGIITVVTAILATFAGGAAVGRTTAPAASKPAAVVSPSPVTAPPVTPTAAPTTATPTPVTTLSTAPPDNTTPTGVAKLSALKPLATNDASSYADGPVQIGTKSFPQSVRFQCFGVGATSVVYDVAGYHFLDATIGVPNDATNAAGNTSILTFLKDGSTTQLSQPVTDVTGHPQLIHLDLQHSAQLQVTCNSTSNSTHGGVTMDVTLADATLTP